MLSIKHIFKVTTLASSFFILTCMAQEANEIKVSKSDIIYVTKQGDTLSSIAKRFTDKEGNWKKINDLNNIDNERGISVGTAIRIPISMLPEVAVDAKVVAFAGEATVETLPTNAQYINVGTLAHEGMTIVTSKNGFATLQLPDSTRISIPSNSQVKINKLRMVKYANSPRTELKLLAGRVESRVASLKNNNGRFEVHSPLAIAGVRGTHFRVEVDGPKMASGVLEGNVMVGEPASPPKVSLPPGKGNVVDTNGVGAAVDLLAPPELVSGFDLQEHRTAEFEAIANKKAKFYRAQIAVDGNAENIIKEAVFNSPQIKFPNLADGVYYLRVTAIDQNGLEGMPSVNEFILNAVPEPPTGMQINQNASAPVTFNWNAPHDAIGYHLQVASDRQFKNIIVNEPDLKLHQYSTDKLTGGSYFWRVATITGKSESEAGDQNLGPFSDPQEVKLTTAPSTK